MTTSVSTDDATASPLLTTADVATLLRQGGQVMVWPEPRIHPLHGRVGELNAQRLGSGLDYAETRTYQAGDDPRHVHWRATARSGSLQVRKYHQEANQSVCVVVDRSAGMRFGTRRRLKVTQAARLSLVLAAQEVRQGSELAALLCEPARKWLPGAVGSTALRRLAACVAAPAPPLAPTSDHDWSRLFGELAARVTPGARIYVISDFRELRKSDRLLLADLGRRFEVRALPVYDVAERELPTVGPLLMQWNEAKVSMDGRDPTQRAQHAAAWKQYRNGLQETFSGAGVVVRFVSTDADDLAAALAEDGNGF